MKIFAKTFIENFMASHKKQVKIHYFAKYFIVLFEHDRKAI